MKEALHDWIVKTDDIQKVYDFLIEISVIEHLAFKLYHQLIKLFDQSNVSNHVLESSLLDHVEPFDVVS
jgi:hypothetical protein